MTHYMPEYCHICSEWDGFLFHVSYTCVHAESAREWNLVYGEERYADQTLDVIIFNITESW